MFVFRLGVGFQLIQLSLHKLLCVLRGILYFDIKYHFALMYFFCLWKMINPTALHFRKRISVVLQCKVAPIA